ncbi:IclR family transcriptional regulator [Pseudonocardia sp. ICBG1142]|uniref:IclR family transcriptional regulator n=1 Tax=Pseudonocardia sp. ICBG1142 TaxID=2846760 RepID=UPI001CF676D4
MSSDVPAASRTLQILNLMAASAHPIRASTISRKLRIPRSTAYHLLSVLQQEGFVAHFPESQMFGLGDAALDLSFAYLRDPPLQRLAAPVIRKLSTALRQPAQLAVLQGHEVVYLIGEQPHECDAIAPDPGVRMPAHLTAPGRAILAELAPGQLRALFSSPATFVSRSGRGPRSLIELGELLADCRNRGFAVEHGDVWSGFTSIAVCARNRSMRPTAAISVMFPRDTHPPESWQAVADRVRSAANALTVRLGGSPCAV